MTPVPSSTLEDFSLVLKTRDEGRTTVRDSPFVDLHSNHNPNESHCATRDATDPIELRGPYPKPLVNAAHGRPRQTHPSAHSPVHQTHPEQGTRPPPLGIFPLLFLRPPTHTGNPWLQLTSLSAKTGLRIVPLHPHYPARVPATTNGVSVPVPRQNLPRRMHLVANTTNDPRVTHSTLYRKLQLDEYGYRTVLHTPPSRAKSTTLRNRVSIRRDRGQKHTRRASTATGSRAWRRGVRREWGDEHDAEPEQHVEQQPAKHGDPPRRPLPSQTSAPSPVPRRTTVKAMSATNDRFRQNTRTSHSRPILRAHATRGKRSGHTTHPKPNENTANPSQRAPRRKTGTYAERSTPSQSQSGHWGLQTKKQAQRPGMPSPSLPHPRRIPDRLPKRGQHGSKGYSAKRTSPELRPTPRSPTGVFSRHPFASPTNRANVRNPVPPPALAGPTSAVCKEEPANVKSAAARDSSEAVVRGPNLVSRR
uniref:Uncharacterized protein n=1 Tax=Mycena chlorophos TaxID=658473 RepID=A0ABQ0LTQ2_MYCCL|nr:predicted protein [Mycena chlorophos]